ncbi:MAG: hypothetical protein IT426_12930 [Pirellulales bacterium]|nr:hypothetical protein [Pirellulales bacterium]
MKHGLYLGLAMIAILLVDAGCRTRQFTNLGKNGREYGAPANSIDGYAKAHGISRAEAAKRMRENLVPPGDSPAEKSPVELSAGIADRAAK